MRPGHVSQGLACQAARHPLQRALSAQTFPSNNVVKTRVVTPSISPPLTWHEPQGHPIYFYTSFPPSGPPFLSFLSPSPFFRNDIIRGI